MTRPELLAPAGDLEKLATALRFGADAVYLGGESFGLRAHAGNFSLADLAEARRMTRAAGRRLYLTLNAYVNDEEWDRLAATLEALRPLDLDAYIISDPGVLSLVKQIDPQREIHLSTQANTVNAAAVNFWQSAGVARVNLARELSLEQMRLLRSRTSAELEVFVHGAMCVAYSGRCLLSAALSGRSANRGNCSHSCRWGYALMEETRPGQHFPVEQDGRGTYLLNSRDLCLVAHLPDLVAAGIDSLKIEGRMKSLSYVAAVTRVYRAALDRYLEEPAQWRCEDIWREELGKVSHRPYDTGFLFPDGDPKVHPEDSAYERSCDFVGVVRDCDREGRAVVQGRSKFLSGEMLEVIAPGMRQSSFTVGPLRSQAGDPLAAGQPNAMVCLELPAGYESGDILRRPKSETR